jgi:hypothetical protein
MEREKERPGLPPEREKPEHPFEQVIPQTDNVEAAKTIETIEPFNIPAPEQPAGPETAEADRKQVSEAERIAEINKLIQRGGDPSDVTEQMGKHIS